MLHYNFSMDLKEYLKRERCSQEEFAKRIGGYQPDVSKWVREEAPVPLGRCVAIERATNGQVTRKDLRPHNWRDIWPELEEKGR